MPLFWPFLDVLDDTTWLMISSVSVNTVDCFHAYGKRLYFSHSVCYAFWGFLYFCSFILQVPWNKQSLHIGVLLQRSWRY